MNKTQLIEAIAAKGEMTKKEAAQALEVVTTTIAESLAVEGKVQIVGFGTFSTSVIPAHEGVNPQDRTQKIQVAESKRVHFSAGTGLKRTVKGE